MGGWVRLLGRVRALPRKYNLRLMYIKTCMIEIWTLNRTGVSKKLKKLIVLMLISVDVFTMPS
jgi:hypothetical protein